MPRPTDWEGAAAKPSVGCLVAGAVLILVGLGLVLAGLNADALLAWATAQEAHLIVEGNPALPFIIIGVVVSVVGAGAVLLGLPSRSRRR